MKIKSIFFNITFKGVLFRCIGFFLIGILLYRSIEVISKSKKVEKENNFVLESLDDTLIDMTTFENENQFFAKMKSIII